VFTGFQNDTRVEHPCSRPVNTGSVHRAGVAGEVLGSAVAHGQDATLHRPFFSALELLYIDLFVYCVFNISRFIIYYGRPME